MKFTSFYLYFSGIAKFYKKLRKERKGPRRGEGNILGKRERAMHAGADLGFSRGGADFQKIFKNFRKNLSTFFFRSAELIFRALPKHCLNILKKQAKKACF